MNGWAVQQSMHVAVRDVICAVVTSGEYSNHLFLLILNLVQESDIISVLYFFSRLLIPMEFQTEKCIIFSFFLAFFFKVHVRIFPYGCDFACDK